MHKVCQWSIREVGEWLRQSGFGEYVRLFSSTHKIDGKALLLLSEQDLKEPPLSLTVLGDIKRLAMCISKLKAENKDSLNELGIVSEHISNGSLKPNFSRQLSSMSDITDLNIHDVRNRKLEPEYRKLIVSYVYMFFVFILTAFTMVVVNDRVPDSKVYPPLPDLFLDNMPFVPWAFQMCEVCALGLVSTLTITLFFHRHRFVILRRLFALTGTVFLLRCFTMVITSLSVPGEHLECHPQPGSSYRSKLERAFVIYKGAGMSLQGVRTCGDYMFSGHTITVTMLNFFVTEYTPRNFHMLHTLSWILNIFGIFFILAAHEHYSIDVFVAFYITSRLFLYYHSLASSRALRQSDRKRTRIWFPMFSYFESRVDGCVPNEYEWPLRWPAFLKAGNNKKDN